MPEGIAFSGSWDITRGGEPYNPLWGPFEAPGARHGWFGYFDEDIDDWNTDTPASRLPIPSESSRLLRWWFIPEYDDSITDNVVSLTLPPANDGIIPAPIVVDVYPLSPFYVTTPAGQTITQGGGRYIEITTTVTETSQGMIPDDFIVRLVDSVTNDVLVTKEGVGVLGDNTITWEPGVQEYILDPTTQRYLPLDRTLRIALYRWENDTLGAYMISSGIFTVTINPDFHAPMHLQIDIFDGVPPPDVIAFGLPAEFEIRVHNWWSLGKNLVDLDTYLLIDNQEPIVIPSLDVLVPTGDNRDPRFSWTPNIVGEITYRVSIGGSESGTRKITILAPECPLFAVHAPRFVPA
jgi:hypothetical protein